MVQIISALAALALVPFIAASPVDTSVQTFSFEKWVDGIIANPEGEHLTPEEAFATAEAQASKQGSLSKRALICHTDQFHKPAFAPDAVRCINDLANKGAQACTVPSSAIQFVRIGNAKIVGTAPNGGPVTSSCGDVARGAGQIMDRCFRADNTVNGENPAWGNGALIVQLVGP